ESGIDEEIIFAGARNPETFFNQMIMPVLACNGLAVILTGGKDAITNLDYLDISYETEETYTSYYGSTPPPIPQEDVAGFEASPAPNPTDYNNAAPPRNPDADEHTETVEYVKYVIIRDRLTGASYRDFASLEEAIIRQAAELQLQYCENTRTILEQDYVSQGLLYYVSDAYGNVATNIYSQDTKYKIPDVKEYFRYLPQYYISGEVSPYPQRYPVMLDNAVTICLGYTQESADTLTNHWSAVLDEIWSVVTQTLLCFAAALFAFIVMLCGAGRRNGTDKIDGRKQVFFTVLDAPYLDISLAILAALECGVIALAAGLFDFFRFYNIVSPLSAAYIAGVAVFTLVPLNAWLCGFAKRCKAGRFWRHTLIVSVCKLIARGAVYLWSGIRGVGQAIVITLLLFFAVLFAIENRAPEIGAVAAFAVLIALLVHFRRLQKIRAGTERAAAGNYGEPINVRYGELGKIADNVNNISVGIDAAVQTRTRAERLKTELITNVSHDIRTPLTSIITYTDLLKSGGFDNENASDYLEIISKKSARLKDLTDELFEAAKASSGNIDVELYTLDFAALVTQSIGELDEKIAQSRLDFRLNLPPKAEVRADGRLLSRILENLFGNALKYALPQTRVYADLTETGAEFRLDIKNISAEPLSGNPSELTERFTRGDSARSGEGSGLGLSIAQSFAEVQGGRFELSVDGDLFKASVYLPKPGAMPTIPEIADYEAAPEPPNLAKKAIAKAKSVLKSKKEW
ncbi:MAG: HAMP domain-containing histidine kinase, partial [Oscillospiraceae bacterium]|nr:HAMP domain-containing histidine kinase [Oscillospiraceae bacterium]